MQNCLQNKISTNIKHKTNSVIIYELCWNSAAAHRITAAPGIKEPVPLIKGLNKTLYLIF